MMAAAARTATVTEIELSAQVLVVLAVIGSLGLAIESFAPYSIDRMHRL
jgi:hypothetical protein